MQEKIYINYTNDLHSNFEQWPRVATYFKQARAKHMQDEETHWIVDIGDHVDRVHPISEAFMGKANVELMNTIAYDVATIGNNEGITLSHEDLYHLYDRASFDVTCANLESLTGDMPHWLNMYTVRTSDSGVRVAMIGMTAPFNDYYHLLQWHIASPYEKLQAYVPKIKAEADIIILLSHLGLNEDQEIARRFPDIDVIIGGHTHHLLRTGELVNNTLLTAAGKHCAFVGDVILTWDHKRKKLINKEAYTTDITHLPLDQQTVVQLNDWEEKAIHKLNQTIVQLDEPIEIKWFQHTEIMQLLTDTVCDWTKADCAMLNAGLLLDDIPAGKVSYGTVHRICPHPINPCVVPLNGRQLMEVVRQSLAKSFVELKLKGFGFRGEVIGQMIFSGLNVVTETHENGEVYVKDVHMDGKPLQPDIIYQVAVPDMFTFGRLLPEVARSEEKHYFLPEFLRDLLVVTLEKNFDKKNSL
ncbi:bifunctional metallophosphatase/5'-nucleotidase [Ornithinibacillus gellani]|uniref:bifunctional metallophosphatase/5'-nucleotidase n=1 Tax=Ornithinibacillus gellani TaxID=2293253 RepID=UPI000F4705E5|nr:bifunctional UDP-sugar hydrolase/5'-nucleotidase [Ornithinibacillus gellani]TQS76000.1 bifunctional metallophosphatase/5'-nucleotidase [Ornithinibacillus gellani]